MRVEPTLRVTVITRSKKREGQRQAKGTKETELRMYGPYFVISWEQEKREL